MFRILPAALDGLFLFCGAFLLLAVFLRFFLGLIPAFFLAALLSAAAAIGFFFLRLRGNGKRLAKNTEARHARAVFSALDGLRDSEYIGFFHTLLEKCENTALSSATRGEPRFIESGAPFFFENEEKLFALPRIYPAFRGNDLKRLWQSAPPDKTLVVLAPEADASAAETAKSLGVDLWDREEIFSRMRQANLFPALLPTSPRFSMKSAARRVFAAANSRRLLLFGAYLLFCSLFSPFPAFYLVAGSLFVLSALTARLFGKKRD